MRLPVSSLLPSPARAPKRATLLALLCLGALGMGVGPCVIVEEPRFQTGKPLFASPQVNPVALSNDGHMLYVANTTSGSVSFVDVSVPGAPHQVAEIGVGIDPVGVAVRPPVGGDAANADQDELVFVTNHISDSISVISRNQRGVVQTLQELEHADGGTTPDDLVTTTDEPVGVAFASPCLAFVTLDQPNQVIALELPDANGNGVCDEPGGKWRISPTRIQVTAQAPRALAVDGNRLYVAAFESGNQTELPTCGAGDTRGLSLGADDEGCEFQLRVIDAFSVTSFNPFRFTFDLGTIFDFAARNPNIGGRVIHDSDIPDRDLFVYDLSAPGWDSDPVKPGVQPAQVIQHLGTLLYGVATDGAGHVFVTHTDARNHNNGLHQLGNRMFENRLATLDCAGGSCAAPVLTDLDAAATGLGTFPTPYGVRVSGNGQILVATAAGSDGTSGFPSVYTLDAAGHVLGGAVTGAIPQGLALRSAPGGAPDRAFVLNTVDSTLSVVDVRNPAQPKVEATIPVGSDPTPPAVRKGRIAFSGARGSTSGTFSCESCHPNGNIDQLLWTINAFEGPDDTPGIEPPEPRTTQPIRGLRDTLPLHWEGRLADPFPGMVRDAIPDRTDLTPGDTAPDCDLATDGEVGCIRHLVNASLKGVMCAQPNCPIGPSGLPGALSDLERNEMATFLQAVSFPPAPRRRPSDKLSEKANLGVQDFFTNEDGLGIGGGVGSQVGFGVVTCADNAIGCHSLPLTAGTNSKIVGGFDVPSARGMWDRFLLFSNGIMSSEEGMRQAQACADGIEPPPNPNLLGLVTGDPCDLRAPNLPFIQLAQLPFPTHEHIYDPEEGYTERGAFLATFEGIFSLAYGVRGDRIWEFQVEIGVGFPGLTGRQVSVDAGNAHDALTVAQMTQLENAAFDGKIVAIARTPGFQDLKYDPATRTWANAFALSGPSSSQLRLSSAQLRDIALSENVVWTLTAELPPNITGGGPDRQPLLNIDPDELAIETLDENGDGIPDPGGVAPGIPRPAADLPASFQIGTEYVQAGASLLVDGAVCHFCSLTLTAADNGKPAADVVIPQGLSHGTHVIQVQNPGGWVSNELPVFAE